MGIVQGNRKNMPKAVVRAKLKKGESCFHRNGELLCLKWCDKHQVIVLTAIDDACMLHRSVKWWRKLFFHMFSLLLNNTYVLHKKFGVKAVAHDVFREHIVEY